MDKNVLKRDGRTTEFNEEKIINAIVKGMERTEKGVDLELANKIADSISKMEKKSLGVEEIQDLVENKLMASSRKDVAKEYITYRKKRNEEREKNTELNKKIENILMCNNIQNSNANVDEHSFGGRKFESAGALHKEFALTKLIREEVAEAYKENRLYIHDLDSYDVGMHNCFGRETRFITSKGVKSFYDFEENQKIIVLTHTGEWKDATVKKLGFQKLNKIVLKKANAKPVVIRATENHKWLLSNGEFTESLSVGNQLYKAPDIYEFNFNILSKLEKDMWCKGFACGDGTIIDNGHGIWGTRIRLCGHKNDYLNRFIECGYSPSKEEQIKNDTMIYMKDYQKELPNIENLTYEELNAFIHGLYDADGTKAIRKTGSKIYEIQFTNEDLIDFVNNYFECSGLYISSKFDKTGQKTNYAIRGNTKLFSFTPHQSRYNWKIINIQEDKTEEVWCLDVEDNHTFVLSGGIVTGNCLFPDMQKLLNEGFITRNGDVRPANSISTAMQLVAVIFQCQSQVQFGGVGSAHIDYDLAPFVAKSFYKLFTNGLYYFNDIKNNKEFAKTIKDKITLSNIKELQELYPKATEYALLELDKEGMQSAQALYHNLNTLESRPGSQLPFTSINFGRDISPEGRKVSEWILKASIEGIGKFNRTSIFPISIFQHKKGVNDKPGTPNYDLKQLAIKSLCKRIYPNFVNGDFTNNIEDPNNPDTFMSTMGCRTQIGKDRFNDSYSKVGRGNASPVTINLPKIGIKHGICLGEREVADIEGFWKEFDELLELSAIALVDRFIHMCNQSVKSAPFMYQNGTMIDSEKANQNGVYEAMKHNTHAIGYIGVAEMCQALFGENQVHNEKVREFALSVVKHIYDFAKEASDKYNLNFSAYATPAEGSCKTIMTGLQKEFGTIENVTDREYLTNSHHVPVWEKVSIYDKLQIEAPFCFYSTAGCIVYSELESMVVNNPEAVEKIIDYAMDLNIPYFAINFPIDACCDCGFQAEIPDECPRCESDNIQRLRRVTGYLTTDYRYFNDGKIAETLDRVKHSVKENN